MLEVEDATEFSDPVPRLTKVGALNRNHFVKAVSGQVKHILTHQNLFAVFVHAEVQKLRVNDDFVICPIDELSNFAMPRLITHYMENRACD
jgi:hypothetical protein